MHLVLRSARAEQNKSWAFTKPRNKTQITQILTKHARKNHIHLQSVAIVGNHIHLHLKLSSRETYKAFIRAVTGAIALAIMQASKLNAKIKTDATRFWSQRPFTSIVDSLRYFQNMRNYMRINHMEGHGLTRADAHMILARELDLMEWRRESART